MYRKISCVVSCPIDTYSGYGGRSRDVVKELIRVRPDWDIKIIPQRWGQTKFGYLKEHKEEDLLSRCIEKLTETPDVWIQITVPNEFQKVGKFNVGMTAAMETTLSSLNWIEGCNRMDLVIVSSEHGKSSLTNSRWKLNDSEKIVELQTPVEVLFEGLDTSRFFRESPSKKSDILEGLESNWNYIFVGHWMQGVFGEDRKNVGFMIKSFLETFKDYSGQVPGLILKTCRTTSSSVERRESIEQIRLIQQSVSYNKSLPKIYLLSGEITDAELNSVYNDPRVKAMISLTKGEGFGRPLLEFAAIGKPIVVSGWSGHMDFLKKEYTALVGGRLTNVHPSAAMPEMILQEASWFSPDPKQVSAALKHVKENLDSWNKKATVQAKIINSTWTKENMGDKLNQILDNYVDDQRLLLRLPEVKVQSTLK